MRSYSFIDLAVAVNLPLSFFFNLASYTVGVEGYTNHTDHTKWHTRGGIPLGEGSARRRGLYLYDTQYWQQTCMFPAGLEPTIPASERPHTYALELGAIGIGLETYCHAICTTWWWPCRPKYVVLCIKYLK